MTAEFREGSQPPQKRGQCVHRQVTCVRGSLRQATDFANQVFSAHLPGLVYILAFDQLRDGRPASHRRHTSFGAKTNVGDALPIQFQGKLQDVSASGVLQASESVGSCNLARVSRVMKMVQEIGRIHRAIVMRHRILLRKSRREGELRPHSLGLALWPPDQILTGSAKCAKK